MAYTKEKVIKRPIITEKSTTVASEQSKYTFEVADWANKFHVKEAVEALFPNRKVKKVNMCKMYGSSRRTNKGRTSPKDSKKAIVTVEGDHIECFPEI